MGPRTFTSKEFPSDVLTNTALEEYAYFLDTWDLLWAGMANFLPSVPPPNAYTFNVHSSL